MKSGRSLTSRKGTLLLLILPVLWSGCGKQNARLRWEDTSNNEEGFRIYKMTENGKTKLSEVGPNVTMYTDTQASSGACYMVTAFNAAGESDPSNVSCLTTDGSGT